MSSAIRWRVASNAVFRWRRWDDEYVLYHDNSGDTHRLSALGARALELLADRACTSTELAGTLAAEGGRTADPGFAAEIDQLLARFHDLGLTERADHSPVAQPARTP